MCAAAAPWVGSRSRGRAVRSLLVGALGALGALGLGCPARGQAARPARAAPAWTRGAVCYEVFVRSFYDSNGDGVGDLDGLIAKLDYINDGNPASTHDLGASCIWLMPVAESPSYHGYDVTDYYKVQPAYGTNADFRRLVTAAHKRGIAVLVDMVLNHTSSRHPHFLAALRDTASPYRAWYRFAPTPQGKGPWGEDVWQRSPLRDEYYYAVFGRDMPDLNYDTPAVRREAEKIAAYWIRTMGVDGFRLDAVQYLVEQGACESDCQGTHAFLREYNAYLRSIAPKTYTIGEVWTSIDSLMSYYPDQLTSYFAFSVMDSLTKAVRTGMAAPLFSAYERMQRAEPDYRWSPILSNHDNTRVMTKLGGDPARAKVAATLLLTLPGLPFVYYGEELGMAGDKPDPRLRTPMQWAPVPGVGFTTVTPWEDPQPDSLTVNVAVQDTAAGSLLNHYRRLIHLRKHNDALALGTLVPLESGDPHVAAYLRRAGSHAVLAIANLGAEPATDVSVGSADRVLAPGVYAARELLHGPNGTAVRVGADGRIRGYRPLAAGLAAGESLVLDLVREGRP